MKQLTLEFNGYPRPVAWTLSEIARAVGDRDHRDMLLTAFEDITRYLTLIAIARYSEYYANDRRSDAVENAVLDLKRPAFGHYLRALRTLDHFLWESTDPYALGVSIKRVSPAAVELLRATGTGNPKEVSMASLLARVNEIRNRDKGHGYTGQYDARVALSVLQPALQELLDQLPSLVAQPLVWIERIEYLNPEKWIVTYLELMGTQRARRTAREVKAPGGLQPRFIYMWNGESAPLQLTPFVHLEETGQDEVVYVLAGIAGEPIYQARGVAVERRPDQLQSQLGERAPFLLKSEPTVTTSRAPDAPKHYRMAVEVALADGIVTPAEAERLEMIRIELGLSESEAVQIHEALGWSLASGGAANHAPGWGSVARDQAARVATSVEQPSSESLDDRPASNVDSAVESNQPPGPAGVRDEIGDPSGPLEVSAQSDPGEVPDWPEAGRRFAARLRDMIDAAEVEPELVILDEDIDVGSGELWVQLDGARGVSLWYSTRRADMVRVIIGFYSLNERRDPAYRRARTAITDEGGPPLPTGWSPLSDRTRAPTKLALETGKRFRIADLDSEDVVREASGLLVLFTKHAAAALADNGEESAERSAPLEAENAPVAADVPGDFPLTPLEGDARIHGSIWIARILWALEWASRRDGAPKSAADISRILSGNGVRVPPTNTARAFRVPRDDPRRTDLCEELDDQKYRISASGRRALFELLSARSD